MTNTPDVSPIVLVVDDSPESLGMLNTALNEAGLTVLVALSGPQALAIIERITPDVILLDAMMPEMDGFQACTLFKQQLPMTPVIFMTGLTESQHVVRGFEVGGVDYVTKPIVAAEVLARIRVHTQNARLAIGAQSALDQAGQFTICLNGDHQIVWATPHVHQLIESSQLDHDALWQLLTSQLQSWLSKAEPGQGKLTCFEKPMLVNLSGAPQAGQQLVRLSAVPVEASPERLREHLSITRRESEVLYWLSFGKSNWEIATILEMSPRTVTKHLEQIYRKLEVDNRTSAATQALRVLEQEEAIQG